MKRTTAQVTFDLRKRGWSFCNKAMLAGLLEQLTELADKLEPDDPRHELLGIIQRRLGSSYAAPRQNVKN